MHGSVRTRLLFFSKEGCIARRRSDGIKLTRNLRCRTAGFLLSLQRVNETLYQGHKPLQDSLGLAVLLLGRIGKHRLELHQVLVLGLLSHAEQRLVWDLNVNMNRVVIT